MKLTGQDLSVQSEYTSLACVVSCASYETTPCLSTSLCVVRPKQAESCLSSQHHVTLNTNVQCCLSGFTSDCLCLSCSIDILPVRTTYSSLLTSALRVGRRQSTNWAETSYLITSIIKPSGGISFPFLKRSGQAGSPISQLSRDNVCFWQQKKKKDRQNIHRAFYIDNPPLPVPQIWNPLSYVRGSHTQEAFPLGGWGCC